MSESADTVRHVTVALSIVGAFTGLAALVAQVWSHILSGPRVRVRASNVVADPFQSGDGHLWVGIDLSNLGRLPVTITDVGVVLETRGNDWRKAPGITFGRNYWTTTQLPHRLRDSESASFFLAAQAAGALVRRESARHSVRVYAQLATGKVVRSRNRIDVVSLGELEVRT